MLFVVYKDSVTLLCFKVNPIKTRLQILGVMPTRLRKAEWLAWNWPQMLQFCPPACVNGALARFAEYLPCWLLYSRYTGMNMKWFPIICIYHELIQSCGKNPHLKWKLSAFAHEHKEHFTGKTCSVWANNLIYKK